MVSLYYGNIVDVFSQNILVIEGVVGFSGIEMTPLEFLSVPFIS